MGIAHAEAAGEAGIFRRQARRLLPRQACDLSTPQHPCHSSKPVITFHALGRAPEVLLESRPGSLQAPQCPLRPAQDQECRWGGMHALPVRCEHRRGAFRTSRGQIQLR